MRSPAPRLPGAARALAAIAAAFSMGGLADAQYVRLVGDGETWKAFRGRMEPPGPQGSWASTGYDDSAWESGVAPFGVSADMAATVFGDMGGAYSSVYVRRAFTYLGDSDAVARRPGADGSPAAASAVVPEIDHLWLTVDYQDGFVAYLNGQEIGRRGLGRTGAFVAHDSLSAVHRSGEEEVIDVSRFLGLVRPGTNVLALQGHGASSTARDFLLSARLHGTGPVTLVRYPYLQRPSGREVVIAWKTGATCRGGVLCAPRGIGGGASGGRLLTGGALTRSHVMRLEDLLPDTEYSYVLTANGRPLTGGDTFRTLPAPGTSRIVFNAVGDSGVNTGRSRALRSRWIATGAPLGLRLGDIAYSAGEPNEFETMYFAVYRDFLRRSFDMPTIGNHEARTNDAQPYLESYVLPTDVPGSTKRYYAFEAGPALFVSIDVFTSDYRQGSRQRAWLEQTLASSTSPWRFVFTHWGPYSCSTSHGSNLRARARLSPLFERYGVDIVFSGHDHGYERSRPVHDFGPGGSPVRYVVSGGGGKSLAGWRNDCSWTAAVARVHEFVNVSVDGPCVSLRAIRADGSVVDSESYCKGP